MIISFVENIDEGFKDLLSDLDALKNQLYQTDWNTTFIEFAENKIDEIVTIIQEQQKIMEDFSEEIVKTETNDQDPILNDELDDYDSFEETNIDDLIEEENRDEEWDDQ